MQTVVLWNTADLGYLTVHAAAQLAQARLAPGAQTLEAGRLGTIQIKDTEIVLGPPLRFTRQNIDRYDF